MYRIAVLKIAVREIASLNHDGNAVKRSRRRWTYDKQWTISVKTSVMGCVYRARNDGMRDDDTENISVINRRRMIGTVIT